MTPQQFIEGQQVATVYIITHFWWLWLLLIGACVGLRWLWDNYYDE